MTKTMTLRLLNGPWVASEGQQTSRRGHEIAAATQMGLHLGLHLGWCSGWGWGSGSAHSQVVSFAGAACFLSQVLPVAMSALQKKEGNRVKTTKKEKQKRKTKTKQNKEEKEGSCHTLKFLKENGNVGLQLFSPPNVILDAFLKTLNLILKLAGNPRRLIIQLNLLQINIRLRHHYYC